MDIYIQKTASGRLVISKLSVSQRWLRVAVVWGLFLVALLPRLFGLEAFLTADEDDQIMFSTLFLKSVLQGDWAGALVLGYPGVPTLILGAIGVGLRYLSHYQGWLPLPWVTADLMTTLNQVTTRFGIFEQPLDFLLWVRVPMALLASLSIVGIYRLTRHLLGERLALFGALIIAFDPFILAHTRIIHVDAPLAYFMFLSFLAFLLYLEQGVWKYLLLSGLFGGLAALSKTPAALLGPILVISGVFYALFPPPGLPGSVRWKRLGLALIGWGMVAMGAFFALWPAMWTRPMFALEWIIRNIQSVNQLPHPTTGIFWTEQQSDQNPLYYLIALPYHLTPLTTVGLIGGLAMIGTGLVAWWQKRPGRARVNWLARVLPLALSLVAYVVIFIGPVSLISRRGDRYILPVFFAVGLLTALTLWWSATWLIRRLPVFFSHLNLTSVRLVGGAILLQILVVLLYHPYYLAYYNPLLGGYRTAPYYVNIGWGEGLDQAAQYLNELTGSNPPQVAAWYSNQFKPFYRGPTIDLSDQGSALTGEYTVFYINQVQRGFPSRQVLAYFQQRQPLHVVKLGGIDYAWIYAGPIISQRPPQDYTFPVEAVLGGGARLIGLDVPVQRLPADAFASTLEPAEDGSPRLYGETRAGLPVTLYWETLAQIDGEHNIYIRLVDDRGNVWGQVDRLILAGMWRPDRWHAGYFIRDEYQLPIDPATPPGVYHFEVSMYDFVTGQSYGLVKNIGEITLTPPERLPQLDELNLDPLVSTPINEALTLVGHTYKDSQLPPGAEVAGKIFWQATQALDQDYQLEFSFLSPDHKKYIMAEMPLSPAYALPQWRRSEIIGTAYHFRIPALAPAGTYPLSVGIIDPETGEPVGVMVPLANLTISMPRRNFALPAGVTPTSAFLNDEIELVGYKLLDQAVAPEGTFGLKLYWRSLQPAAANYTVFVHAVGPDNIMRGQWDSMPAQGTSPTAGWLPGEIIEDDYWVPMAEDAPPWKYDIFVGMYDTLTGQRLPLVSQVAPVSENRVWLTRVQVVEK